MLDVNEVAPLVSRMWTLHARELEKFNTIHAYVEGKLGRPSIPSNADAEVRDIWDMCVLNVLPLVMDAFVQSLSVVGYRSTASDQNAAGWDLWQKNQMDARQAEIYTAAVEFGAAYVVCEPGKSGPVFRTRSPRQLMAVYEDPQVDRWPQYALETWVDTTDAKPTRKGLLIDDEYMYPLDLGVISTPPRREDEQVRASALTISENGIGDAIAHGAVWNGDPVCPVVRYVNRRNTEDLVEGEVYRLLADQRTINEVNFDRLIVARFGAFPQKVISNWVGVTKDKAIEISAKRALTFEDDVKVQSFPAASVEPYNTLIEKMTEHVCQKAQVSLAHVTGRMVNLAAEALAAADKPYQNKLCSMRDSFGESHEQTLQLAAQMDGTEAPDDQAEVIWRDTEARALGAVADALGKIGTALASGAPIEPFLPLLPGVTQQMIEEVKQRQRTAQTTALINALRKPESNGSVGGGAAIPAPTSQPSS